MPYKAQNIYYPALYRSFLISGLWRQEIDPLRDGEFNSFIINFSEGTNGERILFPKISGEIIGYQDRNRQKPLICIISYTEIN